MTESVERLPGEQVEAPDARSATPLIDEANDLAEALDRLRGGEHGTCEECRARSRRPGFEPHRMPQPASDVRGAWSSQRVDSRPCCST